MRDCKRSLSRQRNARRRGLGVILALSGDSHPPCRAAHRMEWRTAKSDAPASRRETVAIPHSARCPSPRAHPRLRNHHTLAKNSCARSEAGIILRQFHPERAGALASTCFAFFGLEAVGAGQASSTSRRRTIQRIVACLDVRSNDDSDLVV